MFIKTGIKVPAEVTNCRTTSYDQYDLFRIKYFAHAVVLMMTGLTHMHTVLADPIDSCISYENIKEKFLQGFLSRLVEES